MGLYPKPSVCSINTNLAVHYTRWFNARCRSSLYQKELSVANQWLDAIGTSVGSFIVGLGTTGVRLKNTAGALILRNKADSADVAVTASTLNASGDSILINSDAAGTGSDWTFKLARNAAQTAALEIQAPPAKGTDGYILRQKAGTSAGVLELELAAPSAGAPTIDTTSLGFGTTSPLTLFSLPADAVINKIEVIIDTTFDGTPSLSIGIAGTPSKYASSTQIDLKEAATTSFCITPNVAPTASAESLIATYAAGSATAGAARILITYSVPV